MTLFSYFKHFIFVSVFIFTFTIISTAQTTMFYNDGATVFVNNDSFIVSDGDLWNNFDSLFNSGRIIVNNGNFVNDGLVSGSGQYEVTGDWENNNTFKAQNSTVTLNGGDQLITGTAVTTFNNLFLANTGIKRCSINTIINNILDLSDRELAADNFTVLINSVNPSAVLRTTGFVSSSLTGRLIRRTNLKAVYLFPVGSSVGTQRYRPIDITPNDVAANTFAVSFVNHDPEVELYDRHSHDDTICHVDSLFYHLIERTAGASSADIAMYFDPAADGIYWDGFANWKGGATNRWKNMRPFDALYGNLNGFRRFGWNDFTYNPYALIATHGDSIPIGGPNSACDNDAPMIYSVWWGNGNPNSTYTWTITGGVILSTDTTSDTTRNILVQWNTPGVGTLTVTELSPFSFCPNFPTTLDVTVYSSPVAAFTSIYDTTYDLFTYDLIQFVNSSTNATAYFWDFADGYTTDQTSPYHVYDFIGTYNVMLIAENVNCTDTAYDTLIVKEGLDVPNVITPNGDGYNDYLNIRNSGMLKYSLQVYNRWGVIIFESDNPRIVWDGKTTTGTDAVEGTYYYVISAQSGTKRYDKTGVVTLLR